MWDLGKNPNSLSTEICEYEEVQIRTKSNG